MDEIKELRDKIQHLKMLVGKAGNVVTERSVYHDDDTLRELAIELVGYHNYLAQVIELTDSEMRSEDKKYLIEYLKGKQQ